MKKCKSCNKTFVGEETVCPYCGSYPLEEIETPEDTVLSFCPYCGKKIENKNAVFCPECGKRMPVKNNTSADFEPADIKQTIDKIKDNEFVKSIKHDVSNSQSINMIKDKVNQTASNTGAAVQAISYESKRIILIAVAVIAALLILVSCVHKCDECGEIYFGKKMKLLFFGQTESLCDDCYPWG